MKRKKTFIQEEIREQIKESRLRYRCARSAFIRILRRLGNA